MRLLPLLLYPALFLAALVAADDYYDYDLEDEIPSVPEIQSKNKYTACEFGWTSLAQNDSQNFKWCIRTFEYYSNTWDYSDSLCGHYGGHLVTLSSEKELKLLEDEVRKATNGKKDKGDFGLWVGLGQMCPKHDPKSTNLPILRWVDGRRVDPNKDKVFGRELNRTAIKDDEGTWKGRYCASINVALNDKAVKSYFSLEHCEKNLPYICIKSSMRAMSPFHVVPASKVSPNDVFNKTPKKPEGFTAEEPCGADPSWCPLTDEKNRTTCYRIVHKLEHRKRSENICEKLHGNLVSVHDDLQREFLVQMASSGVKPLTEDRSKYWIGLHQNNAERSLSWSDSSVLDYFVDLYMPNNTQEVLENMYGNCFALQLIEDTQSKQTYNAWTRQRCDNRLMGICQMDGLGQTGPKRTQSKKLANQKHTNSKCPKEMRLYNGMCYRVFGTELGQNKTFDEAKKACADDGMSLVSITDPYEQAFVTALLGETKTSTDAWIGMEITKGKMMWIDQEPTSFTRFAPTNRMIQLTPGKYLFQNDKTMGFSQDACVSMDGTDMIGYWDTTFTKQSSIKALFGALMTSDQLKINDSHKDDTCDKMKLPYICEKYAEKEEKPQEEKKMPLDAECETHETRGSTYCFLRSTVRAPLTYEEAQKQCEALQKTKEFDEFTDKGTRESQLAVVDDIIEWSFLMSHALHHGIDHFWMGYRFNENTGFQRNDGGRVNIGPWGENQPNLQRGKCVQTTLGPREIGAFWEMEFCEVERPVVCRIADKLPMPIKEPTHKCPDDKLGWILGTTQCYMLVSNSSQISTGYKADHDCFRLFNAHLASFPTAEDFKLFVENEKVKTLIVGTAFIGLVNQNGKFGYTDHSPITFTNWAENQPSSSVGRVTSRDCVHMQLSGEHKWFSENCWTSKHYVCSVPNVLVKEKHQDMSKEGGKKGDEAKTGNLPPLPDETAADSKPDPETPANKDPAPALDPAGQNPPHEVESSNWVTVTLLFLLALVATGTVVVYKLRQKRLAYRMHDHQIMHFDTLQNEDDDGL